MSPKTYGRDFGTPFNHLDQLNGTLKSNITSLHMINGIKTCVDKVSGYLTGIQI